MDAVTLAVCDWLASSPRRTLLVILACVVAVAIMDTPQ